MVTAEDMSTLEEPEGSAGAGAGTGNVRMGIKGTATWAGLSTGVLKSGGRPYAALYSRRLD